MNKYSKNRAKELGLVDEFSNPSIRKTAVFRERLAPSPVTSGEFDHISFGWDSVKLSEITGVSVRTARRWLADPSPLLIAYLRLAAGDLRGAGATWEGFKVSGNGLHHPEWKYAFKPQELRGLYAKSARVFELERLLNDANSLLAMYRCLFGKPVTEPLPVGQLAALT